MKNSIKVTLLLIIISCTILLFPQITHAEAGPKNATIRSTPVTGSYVRGVAFTIGIVVDGGGQNFNAFQADVSVSNLTITNISKGSGLIWGPDGEPAISKPSFIGAVISSNVPNFTVYTLTVKGINTGNASISISNGDVICPSPEAYSCISSVSGSTFTITAPPVVQHSTPQPSVLSACSPNCENKQCGDDGCSGSCGTCSTGMSCDAAQQCQLTTPPIPATQSEVENYMIQLDPDEKLYIVVETNKSSLKYDPATNSLGGLLVRGHAQPNSLVVVVIFSTKIEKSCMSDENGNWAVAVDDYLEEGNHTAYALEMKDGVIHRASKTVRFTVNPQNESIVMIDDSSKVLGSQAKAQVTSGSQSNNANKKTDLLQNPTTFYLAGVLLILGAIVIVFIIINPKKKEAEALPNPNQNPLER